MATIGEDMKDKVSWTGCGKDVLHLCGKCKRFVKCSEADHWVSTETVRCFEDCDYRSGEEYFRMKLKIDEI